MTYYESTGHLLLTPVDREAPERVVRLRELGLGERPDTELDLFARRAAQTLGAPYAGVNFIGEERQFFAGLHHDPDAPASGYPARSLARDHGYCPHVVVRRRALVLEDVRDFARFAGNAVVDESGVRSYLGAPLTDRRGIVLGTVCAVDGVPRRWGTDGLATVKALAVDLVALLHEREDRRGR
ncbi:MULTISPECIES: GAF domain-containing protein [unclassified Streptomyces]|uniref:GAF domain-containing protein n=1 Tax=unclassified Streptomyces TaxID=2593676 RepID=UPI002254F0AF|nr:MULTISPECIES: GAF domain-containing protein [unclassified Streptomyces]MCX4529030.1 GAF domain-containing protein [Streptomyces sp. NBC_01551]MCX4540287.1 GAF domain-containing protein [Streptomyces sp. NBC_01565]